MVHDVTTVCKVDPPPHCHFLGNPYININSFCSFHQPQLRIAQFNALHNIKQCPKKRRKFPSYLPRRRPIYPQSSTSKRMPPRSLQQRPLNPQPHQLNHPLHQPSQLPLNRTRTHLSRNQSLPSHRPGHLPHRLSPAMPLQNASNP